MAKAFLSTSKVTGQGWMSTFLLSWSWFSPHSPFCVEFSEAEANAGSSASAVSAMRMLNHSSITAEEFGGITVVESI